ncbi:3-methyladenine DNA glycosylase [Lithohypha guttulata]|uniref:3-methyladenine DNA glycosylase n=1 Tax=Lithohypha guttulata TaxID=1690604 RepID=A0AAN7YAQ9_9EURO|nr:3-methyladenine DNA glycosylase [Lithohypha guttulata]
MSLRRSSRLVGQPTALNNAQTTSTLATVSASSKKRNATKNTPEKPKKRPKVSASQANEVEVFKKPEGPVTPAKSHPTFRGSKVPKAPPQTPTPSLINIIRAPYSTGDIDDPTPPPRDRLVDPHLTSATLVTPGGTKATNFPRPVNGIDVEVSPTKQPTTTGTLLEKAQAHLISVDPRFEKVIAKHQCLIFSPEGLAEKIDPFRSLTSGICGQQVSSAAASAIKNKFVALFNECNDGVHVWPTPAQVAETSIEKLRTAGLSQRKAEYIQGLAEKFVSGELSTTMLLKASDEEVMEKLIAVRGLGKWSVEMFATFALKRMDILSTGDLGVQRGMAAWFGKDVAKLKSKGGGKWKYMSEQDMLEKSEPYAPYRSLFMWYMWRVADVDTAVLDG